MNKKCAGVAGLFLVTLGCTTTTVPREPNVIRPTATTVDSVERVDSAVSRMSPGQIFRAGTAQYDYRTVSVVSVTAGDTVPRIDTTTVTALVSAIFQPQDSRTIQARINVESMTVRAGSMTSTRRSGQSDTLKINTLNGTITRLSTPQSQCGVDTQEGLVRTDDVLPTLSPASGAMWADTLVRQVCRAGIQFQTRRITTYQSDSTSVEFRLVRSTTTTFSGRGNQWNQPVESAGQSIGVDTLTLDLTNHRRIQQVRGVTQLQLNFKSQFRDQQFQQVTQLLVQLRQ